MKRFHDTYHNEAVVGKVGLVNKPFADRLMLTFTYSQNDKEIQNGVVQEIVYGQNGGKAIHLCLRWNTGKETYCSKVWM